MLNDAPPSLDTPLEKAAAPQVGESAAVPATALAANKTPMLKQFEMVERIKAYDPDASEEQINRAYIFAMKCHGGQLRASGDPYYSHPVEVASILVDMRLDWQTIVVALLHDTVEDTVATLDDIKRLFSPDVAKMVDGVTKLTRIEYQDEKSKQAENFRKLILAMSEDIRVLLVKLADRLHNMRTLHFIPKPDKRMRIARETMDIYAPLAARIGMQKVQEEMENIAFAELYGDAYRSITARLAFLRESGEDMASRIVVALQDTLQKNGIANAGVYGREKAPYSIWRKMQQKNISFEALMDIMAFRIVVGNVEQCYHALGILHSAYQVIPGRFKDYISTPKPNGYQSLHTAVMGPENMRIEVQIRTQDMHNVAELGVAAHWSYKQGSAAAQQEGERFRWLRELVDIVENAQRPEEFLEHTKLELYQDQVFCFSPKGDVVALPHGATPVDFAYAVHSGVGDKCVGAKVNGRIVPLRTELKHGDQVEIITNKSSTPSPAWERFVVTGKARSHIRKFVRAQQRTQYIALGKPMLQKIYQQENMTLDERQFDVALLGQFQAQSLDDLYAHIGMNFVSARDVFFAANPAAKKVEQKRIAETREAKAAERLAEKGKAPSSLSIKGLIPGMAVHYARCCHPVPGDLIVGITTTGKGVTVHTHDCATLNSFQNMPERWLDVAWDENAHGEETVGRIMVMIHNKTGAIATMSTIIAQQDGDITNLKILNRTPEFYEVQIDIGVKDLRHLINVVAALRADPVVTSVDRVKNS